MSNQQPNPITEGDKQRLTEYLIDRVTAGISGRDGADLVDALPSRAIFAGVLQPPRSVEIEAAKRGATQGDAPAGTAIGLDFRVVPNNSQGTLRLTILPRWSHYYPVFPTWQQAVQANDALIDTSITQIDGQPEQVEITDLRKTSVDGQNETPDPNATGVMADAPEVSDEIIPTADVPEEADENPDQNKTTQSGRVILPRVFRRHDVEMAALTVDLPIDRAEALSVGDQECANAIDQARNVIMADTNLWRHLGPPEERQRALGDAPVLANTDAYAKAIAAVKGQPVELPRWSVSLQVESALDPVVPNAIRIRILVTNTTSERDDNVLDPGLEERSLFDARISLEIEGGILLPFDFLLAPKDYRSKANMPAKGINCTAKWEANAPHQLSTESLPIFRQPLYRTKETTEILFDSLDTDQPTVELEGIAVEMDEYLKKWNQFLSTEAPNRFTPAEIIACERDRDAFANEIKRYRLGVETLQRDAKLSSAFRLMNRTFAEISKASAGRIRAWRLFQIGFIVSQLPSLAIRELPSALNDEYAQSLRSAFEEVGVLWFPTGGGKTEAYLGLIAIALLYDRLRGKTRGVCAWMRFPLRMLSLQQLERLARVIAALNRLRAEEPQLRVGDPFAIGYYVGDGVTPNSLSEDDMRRYEQNKDLREEVRLLRKCPFCSSRVDIKPQRANWRLVHVCSNQDCFSNTSSTLGSYKGMIPLFIVDNEIYRYLPSVLVGTVDKLAIIGRSQYFVHLVRGVKQQCPVHGYTSYDECIERWGAGCKNTKKQFIALPSIKDPGLSLLIQDELHLLRAELGVFNGHYEGLLRYLGARAFLPPKVLAATATIEAYDTHAFHIYLSSARRYPQPAWEQGESFYATSKPERYRRFYVGLLGHTRAIEDPVLRLLGLYWREIKRLKANPRQAAAAMEREDATDEAVLDTLRLYDLSLGYVSRKATGGRIIDKVSQIERQLAPETAEPLQSRFLSGDQSIEEVGATLERIERERLETGEPRLNIVVATNLISHGVDLERINMMVVCGMPSHHAEYVQSTSRSARSHPGVIFVCFKARDPRENSQYEFFPAMHEHMDRLIEAVAVNRFASFAPQKTIPGILAGLLLCEMTPDLYGSKITKPLDHIPTLKIALGLQPAPASGTKANCVSQEALKSAIEQIIGVDTVRPPASPAQVANVRKRIEEVFVDQIGAIGRTLEPRLKNVLNPITSFRDVDEGIDFGSIDAANLITRLRAR